MTLKVFRAVAFAVALLATAPALAANAQDELAGGLAIGTAIPQPFALPDQTGKMRDFASLTGKRGLILLFTRSLDW